LPRSVGCGADRDVVDVFAQGIGISYAAFLGLALARVTQPNMIAADWWLEAAQRPLAGVLLAGLAYALILTVFVAIPIALIPVRPHLDTERNARFLAFLHDLANRDDATTLANHAKRIGIDFEGAELNPDIASWRAAGTEERRSRSGAQPLCGDGAAGGAGARPWAWASSRVRRPK